MRRVSQMLKVKKMTQTHLEIRQIQLEIDAMEKCFLFNPHRTYKRESKGNFSSHKLIILGVHEKLVKIA